MLLNDIYETLKDPDQRAIYDEINGFAVSSVNPFMDTRYPRDKVFVDEYTCIGCKMCVNVCPGTFAIEDEYGRSRVMSQGEDGEDMVQEAIDTCPVDCIHWVSGPQLALLEKVMEQMERKNVGVMMAQSGGGGEDVFQVSERMC